MEAKGSRYKLKKRLALVRPGPAGLQNCCPGSVCAKTLEKLKISGFFSFFPLLERCSDLPVFA